MLVSIGSRSVPKIIAITRAFSKYPELWMDAEDKLEFEIMPKVGAHDCAQPQGQETDKFSGVSCNPMSLQETINGAKNRAKNAFEYAKERNRNVWIWSRNRSRNVFCS